MTEADSRYTYYKWQNLQDCGPGLFCHNSTLNKMNMKPNRIIRSAVLFCAAFTVTTAMSQEKKPDRDAIESINVTTDHSNGPGESTINYKEDGHQFRIRIKNEKILEMFVDDRRVDEADYPKYEASVKKILERIEADRAEAQKHREQAEKHRAQADVYRAEAEKHRAQAEIVREQARHDRERADKDREHAEEARKNAEVHVAHAKKAREEAETHRKRAAIDRAHAEEDRKAYEAFFDELVKDKLVESRSAVKNITLDKHEFVIDGVKQAAEIHERYKSKYLTEKRGRIRYWHEGSTKGMSID